MNTYLKEAEVVASWWVNQVTNPTFNNGAIEFPSIMASMMLTSMVQEVSDEQKLIFKDALVEIVSAKLIKSKYIFLDVDYSPCEILSDCATLAGIKLTNFPIKTAASVKPGSVRVSQGHCAPYVAIYEGEAVV
jgi:hypothetical protein